MKFNKQLADKAKIKSKTILTQDLKQECLDYIQERKNKGGLDRNYDYLTTPLAEKYLIIWLMLN